MVLLLRYFHGWLLGIAQAQHDLVLENLALRQQLLASMQNALVVGWEQSTSYSGYASEIRA